MPVPPDGPCDDWPVDMACYDEWPQEAGQYTPAQARAVTLASMWLWRLTAGRYGTCTEIVRPCRSDCAGRPMGASGVGAWQPALYGGQWINCAPSGCGCSGGPCGPCCGRVCEVTLPGPVASVTAVNVDGALVAPIAYQVQNGNKLVRVDGNCWPDCQKLDQPDTQPGTWSITYRRGIPVPVDGVFAVSALARELALACCGQQCRLPQRISEVVREGVTYTMVDAQEWLKEGRTGIVEVDGWLAAVNPGAQRSPSGVWSPDLMAMRHVTWPA